MPTAPDNIKATFEWNNHNIALTKDGIFIISVDGATENFNSLDEARSRLDRIDSRREKVKREKLALKVVDEKLAEYTVTGIHSSTGRLLTVPAISSYQRPSFHPDTPNVRKFLGEKAALEEQLEEIDNRVGPLKLNDSWSRYGRDFDMDIALSELKASYEEKVSAGDEA